MNPRRNGRLRRALRPRRILNAALLTLTVADTVTLRRKAAEARAEGSGATATRTGTAERLRALRAGKPDAGTRTTENTAADLVWLSLLGLNTALNRKLGLLTMAAWSAQPAAVFADDPQRPADLARFAATRPLAEADGLVRASAGTGASPARAERTATVAALRPEYQADMAKGTDRFFEPRRPDCPWCGSGELRVRLRTTDLLQHKPGEFVLEQCGQCRHTFQNPRLNATGLEFYYRDHYDGLGEEKLANAFGAALRHYQSRAASVARLCRPDTWLDVGTGHGHFPHIAAELLPETAFDGIDQGAVVEQAVERGWLRTAYRAEFTERADDLAGSYDVVSMFHYLEHTADPHQELLAARTALRNGGHLVIDVPDPDCRLAPLLGRWWLPYLQPQHLNLVPVDNLCARLTDLGFTVVAEEHTAAHTHVDLVSAMWMALDNAAPKGDEPWHAEPPSKRDRVLRGAAIVATLPPMLAAGCVDYALRPVAGKLGIANAYRVVARLDRRD